MKTDKVMRRNVDRFSREKASRDKGPMQKLRQVYAGGFYLYATFSRRYADGEPVYEDF